VYRLFEEGIDGLRYFLPSSPCLKSHFPILLAQVPKANELQLLREYNQRTETIPTLVGIGPLYGASAKWSERT
jgi:hypothetical protein